MNVGGRTSTVTAARSGHDACQVLALGGDHGTGHWVLHWEASEPKGSAIVALEFKSTSHLLHVLWRKAKKCQDSSFPEVLKVLYGEPNFPLPRPNYEARGKAKDMRNQPV